tara:strand:+ start:157 stop:339 length:183 start_codon:yes stop_codon:yes gene_type:complete
MTKKNKKNHDNLSVSLKKNLKLRKKQVSERNDKKIIGNRTNKIGESQLNLTYNEVILKSK